MLNFSGSPDSMTKETLFGFPYDEMMVQTRDKQGGLKWMHYFCHISVRKNENI